MAVYEGRSEECHIIQCDEDGKCANCNYEGIRYVAKPERLEEDEVAEKYKFCDTCMVNELVDNDWILISRTGYIVVE